jgi:hypothetical protein
MTFLGGTYYIIQNKSKSSKCFSHNNVFRLISVCNRGTKCIQSKKILYIILPENAWNYGTDLSRCFIIITYLLKEQMECKFCWSQSSLRVIVILKPFVKTYVRAA